MRLTNREERSLIMKKKAQCICTGVFYGILTTGAIWLILLAGIVWADTGLPL